MTVYRKWTITRGDITERVFWRLSKSPATHSELCRKFGETFNKISYALIKPHKSYEITASKWFKNEKGENDRIYTLKRFDCSKYIGNQKRPTAQSAVINNHKPSNELRAIRTREAKLRAKLIAQGKYNEEAEKKICGST